MIHDIRKLMIPIVIGISFFIFGFFVTANALDLSLREIVIGLIAGAVGGITTLVAVLHQARARPALPSPAAP